jgi:translocator protein
MELNMASLIVFLLSVAFAALTGVQFSPGEWYETLIKAPWTPPNWLFAPVWTLLYIAIAVAGWYIWLSIPRTLSMPLVLWIVQLILNTAWSWLFFGLHRPDLALIDIGLLLASIIYFAFTAWPVNHLSTWLFVPYILWVSYATSLNLYIWYFNNPI